MIYTFSEKKAKHVGDTIGIKWDRFNVDQFRMGLEVELEHGIINHSTNITNDDVIMTGKIALAHLNEFPDYYDRLKKMENSASDSLEE